MHLHLISKQDSQNWLTFLQGDERNEILHTMQQENIISSGAFFAGILQRVVIRAG